VFYEAEKSAVVVALAVVVAVAVVLAVILSEAKDPEALHPPTPLEPFNHYSQATACS
jgi:hypothetical protein